MEKQIRWLRVSYWIPAVLRRLGTTQLGVWVIKHLVSPLDRWIYRRTGGQRVSTGKPLGPLLPPSQTLITSRQ